MEAIPHKSLLFQFILDLSFGIKLTGIKKLSVNEITTKLTPQESIHGLGHVLPHNISKMAASSRNRGPWYFSKFDINDGYWQLQVALKDTWNFAYVLPQLPPEKNIYKIDIVVPNSLQMGQSKYLAQFCATP